MPINEDPILHRLIRMEEKLDSHLFRTTTVESRVEGHDSRLRTLEQSSSKIMGIAAAVSLAVTTFGTAGLALLRHTPLP